VNRAEKRRQQKLADKASKKNKLKTKQQSLNVDQLFANALQYYAAGQLSDARHIYQMILSTTPEHAEALHHLGVLAQQEGDNDTAIDLITKAISLEPARAQSHNNIGYAYQQSGRLENAIVSYQKSISLKPDYTEALNNLGNVLKNLKRFDEALIHYNNALTIKPNFNSFRNVGYVLRRLGRVEEAVSYYQQALDIEPNNASAHTLLGQAFNELGMTEQAIISCQRAIDIDPKDAGALHTLARIKKISKYDKTMELMERAYADPNLSEEGKIHLAFGLGKSFEGLRRFNEAFDYYSQGNAARRKIHPFSIKDDEREFDNLMKLFTPEFLNRFEGAGIDDTSTIFVLGMPRSGTTLVEQILASHPNVHGAGELGYLVDTIESNYGEISDDATFSKISETSISTLSVAAEEYIRLIRKHTQSAKHITDKMPDNFRLIGMIKLMMPNAKIIHCIRNPKDNCLSIFKNLFIAGGLDYAYDQKELGHYYNLYRNLMLHWHTVLPGFIYDIQYEELIANQEIQSKSLIEFCGLDWSPKCLTFHKTRRPVQTASVAQVRKPIYKDSVDLWKQYQKQLAPLLDMLSAK
jgi:tetratricopeptide (TPR) repeat protein